jgi:hypothetical protein
MTNEFIDHLFTPHGPDGQPEPTLDLFALSLRARVIAYDLAALAGDPDAISYRLAELIDSEGVSARWVFYAIIQSVFTNVTTPLIEAAAKRGFDPRIGYDLTAARLAAEGDPR